MNTEQYKKEIQRTWQTDGLTDREQICNATLGLVGEANEFCIRRDSDELGDVYFYAYTLRRLLGGPFPLKDIPCFPYLWAGAGDVAEAVKKHLFHGTNSDAARAALEVMILSMNKESHEAEETPEEIMADNIEKLRRRYPEGFVMGGGKR